MGLHDGLCNVDELLEDCILVATDIFKEEKEELNISNSELTISNEDITDIKTALLLVRKIKEKL